MGGIVVAVVVEVVVVVVVEVVADRGAVVENTGGAVDVEVVVDGAAVVDQIVVENTGGAVDGIGTMFSSSETVVGQKDLAQIHHEL